MELLLTSVTRSAPSFHMSVKFDNCGWQMYMHAFITANPLKFLNSDWVNIKDLKQFISTREVRYFLKKFIQDPDMSLRSVPIMSIKLEHVALPEVVIKQERVPVAIPPTSHPRVLTYVENSNEVTEILSSEDEMDVDILKINNSNSSDTLIDVDDTTAYSEDSDNQSDLDISSTPDIRLSDYDMFDSDSKLEAPVTAASTTMWLDPNISLKVTYSQVQLTRQCLVECIEEIFGGIPTYCPVP